MAALACDLPCYPVSWPKYFKSFAKCLLEVQIMMIAGALHEEAEYLLWNYSQRIIWASISILVIGIQWHGSWVLLCQDQGHLVAP